MATLLAPRGPRSSQGAETTDDEEMKFMRIFYTVIPTLMLVTGLVHPRPAQLSDVAIAAICIIGLLRTEIKNNRTP